VEWFRKPAAQGDADAQYMLGLSYGTGRGVPDDHKKAAEWFLRAAQQGHAKAQYFPGRSFASGDGVTKDLVQAYMWFDLAAKASPAGTDRKEATDGRDRVASNMTTAQFAKAKNLVLEWRAKPSR